MDLRYATITGVTRDDLPDEGAWLYAETIRQVHAQAPETGVEILTPDFSGHPELLGQVFDAAPEVFAHNLETVPRIFRRIRPAFTYEKSLDVIAQGRAAGMVTKSNLILGMGETRAEISEALVDMHSAGCDLVTITQYLRPSPAAPSGRAVGEAAGVRRAQPRRPSTSVSPASCPVRWSARPTRRARCTGRAPRRARPPARQAPLTRRRHPTVEPGVAVASARIVRRALSWTAWPRMPPVLAPPPKLLIRKRRRRRKRPSGSPRRNAAARSGRPSRCSASRTRGCCR